MIRKVNSLKEEGNNLFLKFVVLVFLLTVSSLLFPINFIYAQEISPTVKKNVVKNFKANLTEYSAFGSDCSKKAQGDANCDGAANKFDLSIWEVEFAASGGAKRSDFNNDGVVNLLDFGVWRGTSYPQKVSVSPNCWESIVSLFHCSIVKSQIAFSSLFPDHFSLFTIYAQETASGGGEINSSSAFISDSGNSLVVSDIAGGNTQQVNFNPEGNPLTAQLFDVQGDALAAISYLDSGNTIISTEESGIQIALTQTSAGPVIENFKNPDGSLIAIKSWPTQDSYTRGDPPISVTIPGQGQIREVLNIQPNGDGIFEKTDALGNVLSRSQLRANGTLVTEDLQNRTVVQSNSQVGFTTLSMKNNLGGDTSYMFYQGQLYAVTQSDGQKKAYIATPLTPEGDSWNFETLEDGVRRTQETVVNPITKLNANTPDPNQLIQYINYYKSASPDSEAVNFSDGFTSTTGISTQIQKANAILTISQAAPPQVLGIIKEAKAQNSGPQIGRNDKNGGANDATTITYANTQGVVTITVADPTSLAVTAPTPSYGQVTFASPNGQIVHSDTPLTQTQWKSLETAIQNQQIPSSVTGLPSLGVSVPGVTDQGGTAPAAPAAPAPPPAPPAGQIISLGNLNTAQSTALNGENGIASLAGKAADAAAAQAGSNREAAALAAGNAAKDYFSSHLPANLFSANEITTIAAYGFVQSYVSTYAPGVPWDQAIDAKNAAITALDSPAGLTAASVPAPGPVSAPAAAPGVAPAAGPAAAPAAAAVTPAVMAASPGATQFTMGGFPGLSVTSKNEQGQTIVTSTFNTTHGTTNFTQNLGSLTTTFQDSRGTFTAQAGVLTAAAFSNAAGYGSPTGTIYALNSAGTSLVAVGSLQELGLDGRALAGHGRSLTSAEVQSGAVQAFRNLQLETAGGGGAQQQAALLGTGTTCFLAGTLISTPNGSIPIETLKPGDKVYSYNEKTGLKQVSDFKDLDINFVDEYLIINGKINTTVYHPFYTVIPNTVIPASEPESRKNNWILDQVQDDRNNSGITETLITVRADELRIGDFLPTEEGEYVPVYSIEKIKAPKTTVYNLMNVSPNNNFFAEGILVHNYSPDVTASGLEDPNPGGNPLDATGAYTESWAANDGWNPSVDFGSSIEQGRSGGTTGDGGTGKAGPGSENATSVESGQATSFNEAPAAENQPADDAPAADSINESTNSNPNPDFGPGNDW